jgi:hypothetical protein
MISNLKHFKNPLVAINEWREKHGTIFGYYFGFKPILVVTDLELLKRVMVKDFHNFIDRGVNNFDYFQIYYS